MVGVAEAIAAVGVGEARHAHRGRRGETEGARASADTLPNTGAPLARPYAASVRGAVIIHFAGGTGAVGGAERALGLKAVSIGAALGAEGLDARVPWMTHQRRLTDEGNTIANAIGAGGAQIAALELAISDATAGVTFTPEIAAAELAGRGVKVQTP